MKQGQNNNRKKQDWYTSDIYNVLGANQILVKLAYYAY